MSSHHSMLVVIDPTTDVQPALTKAATLAKYLGAELVLFASIYDPYFAGERFYDGPDLEQMRSDLVDYQLEALQGLADPLRSEGIPVTCRVVWDYPLHEAIVRETLHLKPDFVVKDTHHHSAISRALFTNTDWHLIRECPSALWLVKPTSPPEHATVVAAIEPTHEHDEPAALDRRIIQQAQLLSVMFEERLHLVHTYNIPSASVISSFSGASASSLPPPAYERLSEEVKRFHTAALERLAADVGFPADQIHLFQGSVETLPEVADELKADMVVMGAVARSRLKRAMIGSTAEMTLDRFSCDVVVVKPDGFVSAIESDMRIHSFMERTAAPDG